MNKLWAFAGCLLWTVPAPAQESARRTVAVETTSSLDGFVQRALQNFPTVRAAMAAEDEARAARGEAVASRWPSLQLTARATQFEEPSLVTPFHGFTPGTLPAFDRSVFTANLSARYTLFDGGGRGARVRQATSRAEAASARRDAETQSIVARTLTSYLAVLTRRDVLRAHDRRRAALAGESDRASQLFRSGRAARVEVLRAEATLARAEAERVQAAALLDAAERDLARLAGTTPDSARATNLASVALADTALPDRESVRRRALDASPFVVRAVAEVAASRAGAAAARSARWPGVQLFGNYNGWSDDDGHDALEWNAGAELAYPLFTGGARRHAIERSDAARRGAEAVRRQAELELEESLDTAWTTIVESRARVQSLETAVARSEEVARVEALALEAGSGTQTDYLAAEAEQLASRAALAEARNAEIASRAALARAAGELDLDWIARALEVAP